jgi:hypothetical protein
MESQQIFWIVVFGFLLITHSIIYYVVVTYEKKLKKKEKGKGGYLEYIKKMARKENNKKEGFLEGLAAKEKGEEAASGAAGTLGPTKTGGGKGGKSSGSKDNSGVSTKSGDKKKGHIQAVAGKGGGRALNKKPLAKKKISAPSGTLGKVPTKNTCKKDPGMCKGKFLQAYKATGCDAAPTTAVIDWWREKKDDSDIWKNMLTRCQKSQKCLTCKTDTDKKAAIKECRISGIPAKTCKLQTGWPKTCTEVASAKKSGGAAGCPTIPIPSSIKAAETKPKKKKKKEKKPLVCPTESPEKPGDIPQPRKRGPQCPVKWQIPGHRHNVYDPERMKVLTEIKGLMGLLRKKMDLKGRPPYQTRLTPEQYKLWLKAIGALKVRKKIKKKPQPISVNVDVTDSRVLEYEVPSALISLPGTEVTGKNQLDRKRAAAKRLKKLLQSLNLNPETRDQVKKALDDYDGLKSERSLPKGEGEKDKKGKDKRGRGKGGGEGGGEGGKDGTRPGRSEEEDRRNEMRKHKSSQPAKFQDLLKAVQKNPYLAYNEDDYGDITKQIKGAKSK